MLDKKYVSILGLLGSLLKEIEWFVIGKSSLALQGEKVDLNHLSILISYRDIEEALECLSGYNRSEVTELSNGEGVEFTVNVNGSELLVCAEFPDGTYLSLNKEPVLVDVDGLKIRCVSKDVDKKAQAKIHSNF